MARRLDLLLYLISEEKYSRGRSLEEMMEPSLRGGASAIQLRNKNATTRELLDQALRLRALVDRYPALFIVNDRVDIALASGADGVHLGAEDFPPRLARKLLGPEPVIGLTVRGPSEASAAADSGVDYVAAGSVFESRTKRAQVIGLDGLVRICRATTLPVVAIGGIGLADLEDVFGAGASGVAVAKDILDAEDIEERTRSFRSAIEEFVSRRSSEPFEGSQVRYGRDSG